MSFTDDQVCRRRFAECCYGKAISRAGTAAAVADGIGKRLRGQRQYEYLDALLEAFSLHVWVEQAHEKEVATMARQGDDRDAQLPPGGDSLLSASNGRHSK